MLTSWRAGISAHSYTPTPFTTPSATLQSVYAYSRPYASAAVAIPRYVRARELAKLLKVDVKTVTKVTRKHRKRIYYTDTHGRDFVFASQRGIIFSYDDAAAIAKEHGWEPEVQVIESDELPLPPFNAAWPAKVPVVAVMGHVDHGKSTLFDRLRGTRAVRCEAGGITQKLEALSGRWGHDDSLLTLMDTPGHAAFHAMRAVGAEAADILMLIVAADEGIQTQTREALQLANEYAVHTVAAVNKVDIASGHQVRETTHALVRAGVRESEIVHISAKFGSGVEALCHTLSEVGGRLNLKAPREDADLIFGTLVEEDTGNYGRWITLVAQQGCIERGMHWVYGDAWGRVASIVSTQSGSECDVVKPGEAARLKIKILKFKRNKSRNMDRKGGLSEPPGGSMYFTRNADDALAIAEYRDKVRSYYESMESLVHSNVTDPSYTVPHPATHVSSGVDGRESGSNGVGSGESEGEWEGELPPEPVDVILKTDTAGELVMLLDQLADRNDVRVVHGALGAVTRTDIVLAETGEPPCPIMCFNTHSSKAIVNEAASRGVAVSNYVDEYVRTTA